MTDPSSTITPIHPEAPQLPWLKHASAKSGRYRRFSHRIEGGATATMMDICAENDITPGALFLAITCEVITRWAESPQFTLHVQRMTPARQFPDDPTKPQHMSLAALDINFSDAMPLCHRALALQHQLGAQPSGHKPQSSIAADTTMGLPVVVTDLLSGPTDPVSQGPNSAIRTDGEMADLQIWLEFRFYRTAEGGVGFDLHVLEDALPDKIAADLHAAAAALLTDVHTRRDAIGSIPDIGLPMPQAALIDATNDTAERLFAGALTTPVFTAARKFPDNVAIVNRDGGVTTYRELAAAALEIGKAIDARAAPDDLVPILIGKGPMQIAAVLAVLSAGCVYVPIDPEQGEKRIEQILRQTRAGIALVETPEMIGMCRRLGIVPLLPGAQPVVGTDAAELDAAIAFSEALSPTKQGYIIFTSGTTGAPKGVVLDHAGPSNTCSDINKRYQVCGSDKVLAVSELTFDLSVFDIFGLLAVGGTIVLPDRELRRDPAHWLALMNDHAVTIWNSAPMLMVMLVEYCEARQISLAPSLRLVLLSGDWIPVDLPRRLHRLAPQARIVSLGGATEASIWSILHEVDPHRHHVPSIPYGRPMANQSFHVLDTRMRERPIGTIGELYIGGIGLAKGYYGQPELTESRFIRHPLSGQRLYRTGDMGRRLEDGSIQFHGRRDFQVKVQGFRIELGEIEAALNRHPAIRESVVMAAGEKLGTKSLVSWFVPSASGDAPDPETLGQWMAERLPAYMVPVQYRPVTHWPTTSNGKVDRNILMESLLRSGSRPSKHDAPVDIVSQIYTDVLGRPSVDPEASFFSLGGTSIEIVRLQSEILRRFDVDIRATDLFRLQTVKTLSEHLANVRKQAMNA